MELDSILQRIKKLLALADGTRNNSPEEAAAAAAKAQALLFRYNLELADVTAATADAPPEGIEKYDYTIDATRTNFAWKGSLLAAVSGANFCRVIRTGGGGSSKMCLVGKASNVQSVIYLFEYLAREIDRLAGEICRREGIFTRRVQWARSFCMGAVSTVTRRLREQKDTQAAESAAGRALVVVSDRELDRRYREFFPHIRTSRSTVTRNGAYLSGQRAGEGISWRRGVEAGTGRRLISS
jgi:hypothetical protein